MNIALDAMRKAVGDYSPDENGTWNEALSRYGKGNNILGELGLKNLRTSTAGAKISPSKNAEPEKVVEPAENAEETKNAEPTKNVKPTKNAKSSKKAKSSKTGASK